MPESRIKSIHGDEYGVLVDCLRSARRTSELTQVELGERLGADQSYVSKYERGERRLDVIELREICKAFRITLAEFIKDFEESLRAKGLS